MENLLKMTKRELFEKIVKEINSKEYPVKESWKISVLNKINKDIEEFINDENVRVWKKDLDVRYKTQVVKIFFRKENLVLQMPIIVTYNKQKKLNTDFDRYCDYFGLKKIRLDINEINEESLDMTIEELVNGKTILDKKEQKIIDDYEKRVKELPSIFQEVMNAIKNKEEMPFLAKYRFEDIFKGYEEYLKTVNKLNKNS